MAQRDTNIALNLTRDEPAIQTQNSDGSITVYGTPEPPGDTTSENVPGSPLAAEIAAFEHEVDHPEDWTAAERRAVGLARLHPDLTQREICDRLDLSRSVVRRGQRKAALADLSEEDADEIHAAFQQCTSNQQAVIAAKVADPDASDTALAERVASPRSTVKSVRRRFQPLIRRLKNVGVPPEVAETTNTTATKPTASETNSVESDDDDHSTGDNEQPSPQLTVTEVKQFVTALRDCATDDYSLSEMSDGDHRTVRQVTCDAILAYITTARTDQ